MELRVRVLLLLGLSGCLLDSQVLALITCVNFGMTQYWHNSTTSAIHSFGSSSEPRIIGLPVDTPRDRRWLLLLLIGLRVNESVFEPETPKLHSVNAHYHLLNCVCSTHQQTSL